MMGLRGDPIARQKVLDALEVLGLDPNHTRQVTITSGEVQVVRYVMDGDKLALDEATGEPRTWMKILPIADLK